jgi:hypothetical protein
MPPAPIVKEIEGVNGAHGSALGRPIDAAATANYPFPCFTAMEFAVNRPAARVG